ncbi:C4-dicarboxylate transport sensor protein DctB [Minicystis rosea]|nr:C4-dicarboxylate transport sensor protein DctB [Minicystis rosea]
MISPPAPAASPDGASFGPDEAGSAPDESSGWASLRRPRLGVFLSAPLASPAQVKDRWLVQLRWLALAGMTATVITARMLVPGLRTLPLAIVLVAVLATNLAWTRLVRAGAEGSGDQRARQILCDAVLLTALLWFSGGLHNPFAFFLTFQIALAGALCDGRTTARVGLLAGVSTAVLAFAPRLPLEGAPLGAAVVEMLGRLAAIVSLGLFLGAFAVVYARKLTELREASERNQRLAMLGRLVGGMSHELATPLGTILLGSRDLCEITREESPEAAELANAIAAEAERATDIIGLLRGHIRPDQRAEMVDLSCIVPEIARRELDRLGFSGARVVSAPDPVSAAVLRVGLAQVLRNLLANAVHATSERHHGGDGRIEIAIATRGDVAEVSITDNGPGFSPEIVERLGEPFQTTKEEGEGLGLGLYVSTVLARQMHATLRAENAEGGGARVTLTLDLGGVPSKPGCAEPARTKEAP